MGIYFNSSNETILFKAECLLYPLLNYTPAIITPVKTSNTVTMLLNPSIVDENNIEIFNESKNATILQGSYIIDHNGSISTFSLSGEENISIKPWTIIIPNDINIREFESIPINFSFNQFMAEFSVNNNPGYLVETSLPLPYGGIIVNNGKALGVNGFGQYVFTSDGKLTISIKLGFITDLLMTAVDIFFYALFIYFFVYKNIFKGLGTEVFRNVITRISRLKSYK
ncbi:hypothetical protein [Saccharolobus solfataricus]|nr:hypothetical protein [Saccharolobus solfataricus]